MNLVLHQFRADFQHLRGGLLLFWATLPLMLGLGLSEGLTFPARLGLEVLLALLQIGVAGALVVRLIHGDPFVGANAFWPTRPLSAGTLVAARGLWVAVTLLGPFLLAQGALWWGAGWEGRALPPALAGRLLLLLPFLLTVMVLAGLTRTLPQFLLAAAGAWVLAGGVIGVIDHWLPSPPGEITDTAGRSAALVALAVLLAASLGAWLSFAGRRRPLVPALGLAAGLVGSAGSCMLWSWDFLRVSLPEASSLRVTPLSDEQPLPIRPDTQALFGVLAVRGLATNQVAGVTWLDARLERPRQAPLQFHAAPIFPGHGGNGASPGIRNRMAAAFPPRTRWHGGASSGRFVGLLPFWESPRKGLKWESGRFQGTARLLTSAVELVAEAPLQPGLIRLPGGLSVALQRVRFGPQGWELLLEEREARWLFRREWNERELGRGYDLRYVIYLPDRQEAFLPSDSPPDSPSRPLLYRGQFARLRRLYFSYPPLRRRLVGAPPPASLARARLYLFLIRPVGIAERSFAAARFTLRLDGRLPRLADCQAALDRVRALALPADATEADAAAYVARLLDEAPALLLLNRFPLWEKKLAALAPRHLDALIRRLPVTDELRAPVQRLLFRWASPQHLPLLLTALRRDPSLVGLFQQKGWEAQARPVLQALLPDLRVPLPADALAVAATNAPPALYPALARRFVLLKQRHDLVWPALCQLPDFDLETTVRRAWRRARLGLADPRSLAVPAARYGLPGALDTAIDLLDRDPRQLTGYPSAWLARHWSRFRYDSAARRYRWDAAPPRRPNHGALAPRHARW